MTTQNPLFPKIEPYASGFLRVSALHELYWEQSGNPDGVPVVLLHGGPGGGTFPLQRQFFDPEHYRIILFDQRGCGRSHPLRELKENTTHNLVQDIEALRMHLSIENWHIFGGSWGATLALHYAQKFSAHCLSLTLCSIFLCEQSEVDHFLYGMKDHAPDAWQAFANFIPEAEHDDLLDAYYKRLCAGDIEAGKQWHSYEVACSSLKDRTKDIPFDLEIAMNVALLEAHYFKHEVIEEPQSLLHGVDQLRDIPAIIIQGASDIVTPVETAYKLHKAWPEAKLVIVPNAGHSSFEPDMASALIDATESFKNDI